MMAEVKPFIKWAGGKGKLLPKLDALLPCGFGQEDGMTYVEPFVGGGAMLFHLLRAFGNIKCAVINDINRELITCYKTIRDTPDKLIRALAVLQDNYLPLEEGERKEYYLHIRKKFNEGISNPIDLSASFIFLNQTCFNGLYRVNKAGKFNVPHGKYENPLICDAETILADSEALRTVDITSGDFEQTLEYADERSFFYIDPPYKPLSATSCFTSYSKDGFGDAEQMRLKGFCDEISKTGGRFMLSNSSPNSSFFSELYNGYDIQTVFASRQINAKGTKRGAVQEIVVRNYC